MGRGILQLTVFLLLIINLLSSLYLINSADSFVEHSTAHASAEVALCINAPPEIVIPCNATLSQDSAYSCQLQVNDANLGQEWNFSAVWEGVSIFSVSEDGEISFTPDNGDVGNHSVLLVVNDQSGCANAIDNATFNFSVANINDAPILLQDIPDVEIVVNTTYFAFFLTDYFQDPDGDSLTFTNTIPGSPFTLTLVGGTGVRISANQCNPEEQNVQFFAEDPYGLSASSNIMQIKVLCPDPETSGGGGEGQGTTGGGSGGGAGGLCRSEWECLDWMSCLPTGYQWRQCYDIQGCEDPKFFKRECDYQGEQPLCEENWLCENWGPCYANETQYRTCSDLGECNTQFFKPFVEQHCTYIPTCNDGIRNGNETAIDCGGECGACPVIETPEFIPPEQFNMWLLISLLVAAILISGVMRLYHEELMHGLSKLLLIMSRRHPKEVLLTKEERNILFEKILAAEQAIDAHDTWDADHKYEQITRVARTLYTILAHLPEEFGREEMIEHLPKMSKELKDMLIKFFDKIYLVEENPLDFNDAFFYSLAEELRLIVCILSDYTTNEVERPLKEFELTDKMSYLEEILVRHIRIYRALQFHQYEFARSEYQLVLTSYENLPKEDQEPMYEEITHLFMMLRYAVDRLEA